MKFYCEDDQNLFEILSKEYRKLGFNKRKYKQIGWRFIHKEKPFEFCLVYNPLLKSIEGSFSVSTSNATHPLYWRVLNVFIFWKL